MELVELVKTRDCEKILELTKKQMFSFVHVEVAKLARTMHLRLGGGGARAGAAVGGIGIGAGVGAAGGFNTASSGGDDDDDLS